MDALLCLNCLNPLPNNETHPFDIVTCGCGMVYSTQLLREAHPALWAIAVDPHDNRIRLERAVMDGQPRVIVHTSVPNPWEFLDGVELLIDAPF
jgi:hypothetical protein